MRGSVIFGCGLPCRRALEKLALTIWAIWPGGHICVSFYQTKTDLFETVLPYLQAGLENNEFCIWAVPGPVTVEDANEALRQNVPDFDKYLAAESIEILPAREWYLEGGGFDPRRVTQSWRKRLRDH